MRVRAISVLVVLALCLSWISVLVPSSSVPVKAAGTDSYWRFDEGSGTTAFDSVGGNNGVLANGPVWTTGKVQGALSFDGSDDRVDVPYDPSLDLSEAITIEVWVKWNGFGGRPSIVNKRPTNSALNYNFVISDEIAEGRLRWSFSTGSTLGDIHNIDYNWSPNTGQWYFIATTYDSHAGVAEIFVDGAEVRSESVTGTMATGDAPFIVGRSDGDLRTFNGTIDELAIRNIALTPDEVSRDYDLGLAGLGYGGFAPTYNTPVGSPVTVPLNGVITTFNNVTVEGNTSMTWSAGNPAGPTPPNFYVAGWFTDITTTATYSGSIIIGLSYSESNVRGDENELRLYHQTGSTWADVTTSVDTANNIVYGRVSSLSWFFIGGEWVWIDDGAHSAPAFPNLYIGIGAALGAGILAYFMRRRLATR